MRGRGEGVVASAFEFHNISKDFQTPNPPSFHSIFLPLQLDIWDHGRSEPVASFSWGADTLTAVRFNTAEPDLLATCASDRGLALYDLRSSTPIRKIVMQVAPFFQNMQWTSSRAVVLVFQLVTKPHSHPHHHLQDAEPHPLSGDAFCYLVGLPASSFKSILRLF